MTKGSLESKLQFDKKNKDLIRLPKREPSHPNAWGQMADARD